MRETYYQRHRKKILKYANDYYYSHREICLERCKNYTKNNPYERTLCNIRYRCNNPIDRKYRYYGGKGIKCFLTLPEIKLLWFRDKAYLMEQPSIDRKNNKMNYTFENCHFIEMSENRIKRG